MTDVQTFKGPEELLLGSGVMVSNDVARWLK